MKKIALQLSFPFSKAKARSRVTYREPARRNQIRSSLEDALLREPPPSLNVVARSLRMSSSTRLREIEPELSRRLTELRQSWNEKQEAGLRAVFEAEMKSKSPLSLERFCKDRGISIWVLRREFPDIKDAYTSRFRTLQKEARKVRVTARVVAVTEAVSKIRRLGRYPSVGQVKSMSPTLKAAGWDELQAGIELATMISQQKGKSK